MSGDVRVMQSIKAPTASGRVPWNGGCLPPPRHWSPTGQTWHSCAGLLGSTTYSSWPQRGRFQQESRARLHGEDEATAVATVGATVGVTVGVTVRQRVNMIQRVIPIASDSLRDHARLLERGEAAQRAMQTSFFFQNLVMNLATQKVFDH